MARVVADPQRTYLHQWQKDDFVCWDERSVFHRARPYDPQEARRLYGTLSGGAAAACVGCAAPCESACFHGLGVHGKMLAAHASLA